MGVLVAMLRIGEAIFDGDVSLDTNCWLDRLNKEAILVGASRRATMTVAIVNSNGT
jgi:hypothetical protein